MLESIAVVADMAVGVVIIDEEVVVIGKDVAGSEVRGWQLHLLGTGNLEDLFAIVGKVATCLIAEVSGGFAVACNLDRVIYSLGIRQVGQKTATVLASRFGNMKAFSGASEEDLTSIDEIGPVTAHYISDFFANPHNISLISELDALGVNMVYRSDKVSDIFAGMTFVLTGTLPNMTRTEAYAS